MDNDSHSELLSLGPVASVSVSGVVVVVGVAGDGAGVVGRQVGHLEAG